MLDGADEAGGVGQGVEGAGVEPGGAAGQDLHGQPAGLQVGAVDVGDLVLTAGGGLEALGDLDDVVVIEVQAGHGVVGAGLGRLLLDGDGLEALIELDHAVGRGVGHLVGVDDAAVGAGVTAQLGAHAGAVEDVVAQDQGGTVVTDEVGAQDECLSQAVGLLLNRVGQVDAELGAVAQETVEGGGVVGGGDDQDVLDPGEHEGAQRVVDHRLVVDGHQLLGGPQGDRVESRAGASGQNDSSHAPSMTY